MGTQSDLTWSLVRLSKVYSIDHVMTLSWCTCCKTPRLDPSLDSGVDQAARDTYTRWCADHSLGRHKTIFSDHIGIQ